MCAMRAPVHAPVHAPIDRVCRPVARGLRPERPGRCPDGRQPARFPYGYGYLVPPPGFSCLGFSRSCWFTMSFNDVALLLQSVDIKIGRARNHLGDLIRETDEFIRSKPYEVTRHSEPDRKTETFHFQATETPPPVLSAITGDFLHNCRSALDHLVFAAWVAHSGQPNSRQLRSLGFPVAADLRDFNPGEVIGGVSPRAFTVVEGMQPYRAENPTREPLYLLHRLSNIDKHRKVHFMFFQFASVGWFGSPLGRWLRGNLGILEAGTEIAAFEWATEPDPNVDFIFHCDVAFGEGPASEQRVKLLALRMFRDVLDIRDRMERAILLPG